ncbi:DgyrCDS4109 [Dimorphilus gyrociliatus]|uniref:DgyrCDS4109 n=1 Tax=Dimorphilus gyrociliatus TaxID=2664684 RepID=A0A7I8VFF6_9ANNE|nr:DgyrCDS4109 [Dimorphilus gyrociliatus]
MDKPIYDMNPWEDDRSVGQVRNLLFLANKTGHLKSAQFTEEDISDSLKRLPSIKLISMYKKLGEKRETSRQKSLESIRIENENSVKDLIYSSSLEEKRYTIAQINSLFTSINNNQSKVIEQLKRPFVANSIKVESQYRNQFYEIVTRLTFLVSELTQILESLLWLRKFTDSNIDIEEISEKVCKAANYIEKEMQLITSVSKAMEERHKGEEEDNVL